MMFFFSSDEFVLRGSAQSNSIKVENVAVYFKKQNKILEKITEFLSRHDTISRRENFVDISQFSHFFSFTLYRYE